MSAGGSVSVIFGFTFVRQARGTGIMLLKLIAPHLPLLILRKSSWFLCPWYREHGNPPPQIIAVVGINGIEWKIHRISLLYRYCRRMGSMYVKMPYTLSYKRGTELCSSAPLLFWLPLKLVGYTAFLSISTRYYYYTQSKSACQCLAQFVMRSFLSSHIFLQTQVRHWPERFSFV